MRHHGHLILICSAVFSLSFLGLPTAFGQTKSQPRYISKDDQDLTIKTVTMAPFTDNLSGIYAKPLTEHLRARLGNDPRWSLVPFPERPVKTEKLDADPNEVLRILRESKADALLAGRLLKGPAGISLQMALYTGPAGQPLVIEEAEEKIRFETDYLKSLVDATLLRLRQRLPYQATVVSRRGQQVTINLGGNSGLREGTDVDVVQILKVHRHPKLNFMIAADKEILGKVRISKADEELSFGDIVFEKEAALIAPGMKVFSTPPVVYPGSNAIADRADKDVAFGDKPVEWLPENAPQFGRVQIMAGIGQYTQAATLIPDGSIEGSNGFTPNLGIMGEGWLNRDWWIGFDLRQSAFSINNGLANSSPGKLNMSLSKYTVSGGYNFLLGDDFFGPKIQLGLGLGKFSARVDESAPVAFSNMEYGGTVIGFAFNTPVDALSLWDIGAKFKYYFSPGVSESVSSGDRKSVSANDFSFMIAKRVRQNFRYVGEFNMEYYNSDFDGGGARPATSASHRVTTLMAGLEYLF
ncbi:MAG: hypothetical protein KF865_09525 [Bdellovibrionaceae bacterium]|nr:hypothetical protein [Pseudobdellovibrionaceae bacterium]